MRRAFVFALFVFVVLSSLSAQAQVPDECLQPPRPGARDPYTTGLLKGQSMILSAWRAPAIGESCDNVDQFADAVESMLHSTALRELANRAPSIKSACELTGWTQGATDQLDAILGTCADECFGEGQFMGELAAIAYCELSILLGGLAPGELLIRGPVQVCGLTFETGCDTNFVISAGAFRNPLGTCAQYTRSPYLDVFLETQNNQCAYNPQDPDDADP